MCRSQAPLQRSLRLPLKGYTKTSVHRRFSARVHSGRLNPSN
jgi:hypothetical protein